MESRTTILNPAYIKEKMKGGAGDASAIAEVITNTYGWNVMKPDVIDNELWNDIYDTYVADKHSLGTKEFFSRTSPAALQEMTAVMLETARKGMWKASDAQLRELAKLHAEMIEKHGAACTGFVCDNAKLRDYIAGKLDKGAASAYSGAVAKARGEKINTDKGTVMKKEEMSNTDRSTTYINGAIVAGVVLLCLVGIIILIRRRRKTLRK